MRTAQIKRKTMETDIELDLDLDGTGKNDIDTGVGFLDHMLTLFSKHGRFDLEIFCRGDIYVDYHHTTEDIGIALGQAFDKALADKAGIRRYGNIILPMDEALILSAVDISGRGLLSYDMKIPTEKVGDFDCQLVKEFFQAFTREGKLTLHIKQLSGENSHHIIEGAFKSVSRSLKEAVSIDPALMGEVPSTKGVL